MPDPTPLPAVLNERCRCLRAKEMFIDGELDLARGSFGSGFFWCLHTQNCLGPDGQVADPERCKPGRSCYEPL